MFISFYNFLSWGDFSFEKYYGQQEACFWKVFFYKARKHDMTWNNAPLTFLEIQKLTTIIGARYRKHLFLRNDADDHTYIALWFLIKCRAEEFFFLSQLNNLRQLDVLSFWP